MGSVSCAMPARLCEQIGLVVVGSHNRAGIAQLTQPNGVAALTDSGSSVLIGNNRRL